MNDTPHDLRVRWENYLNDSGETVPAYGCIQLVSTDAEFVASKPTVSVGSYAHGLFAFNGPLDVADGEYGLCSFDFPCWALYDDAEGEVSNGSTLAPGHDTFRLRLVVAANFSVISGTIRFRAVGPNDASNDLIQVTAPEIIQPKLRGKLDGALSQGGSATMSVWYWNGSAEADTGYNVTVYDWLLSSGQTIAAGKKVTAFWDDHSQRFYVDSAECVGGGS